MTRPVLYSFRRCPYAMRARLAIQSAGIECELREIVLREKAPEFLDASPKGTVPVVVHNGLVIEESFDVMKWALQQNDPEGWLNISAEANEWIQRCDGPFKANLDRTKYANRFPETDPSTSRQEAGKFLHDLNIKIGSNQWMFGDKPTLADFAILPFIRQFANVDRAWFDDQGWSNTQRWLDNFLASARFASIMRKYPKWTAGDPQTVFPGA